jgi:hypothetical protein
VTFAVSFLASGFTETGTGPAGAGLGAIAGAGAGVIVGDFGAAGGTAGPATAGFGTEGAEGAAGAAGAVGGLGTPGNVGGFGTPGAAGGVSEVGGFGAATAGGGTAGAAGVAGAAGAGVAGTGFGGRLIMAVSRGVDARGWPSRRGGRTMRTVSFFGSLMFEGTRGDSGVRSLVLSRITLKCQPCKGLACHFPHKGVAKRKIRVPNVTE